MRIISYTIALMVVIAISLAATSCKKEEPATDTGASDTSGASNAPASGTISDNGGTDTETPTATTSGDKSGPRPAQTDSHSSTKTETGKENNEKKKPLQQ